MNLSKSITSINDKELAVAQLTSTQFLYQIIQKQSQSITELKNLIVSQSDRMDSLESIISNMMTVATIPKDKKKTYKYGELKLLGKNSENQHVRRSIYCVNDDGSVYAWKRGKTADPPEDGILCIWKAGEFQFIDS